MLTRRARVIVNPMSASGTTRWKWLHIRHILNEMGLAFDYDYTEGTGHATDLAREAVAEGYDMVVAIGGDGTINEVVNGLVDFQNRSEVTLGIISSGTANSFARSIGISQDYRKACRQLSQAKGRDIDVGVVEYTSDNRRARRLFLNVAGLGFDAATVEITKQQPQIIGGVLQYAFAVLATFATYRNKEVALTIDGTKLVKQVTSIIVSNGRYFAGSMLIAPDADLSDGSLDVTVIGDLDKLELVRGLASVYQGKHIAHPKVSMHKAARVEVQSSERMLLEADGELLGETTARFWVLPAALRVTS